MSKKQVRAIISTVLVVAFLLCLLTGIILFFLDVGMLWIFTRRFLTDVHNVSGFILGGGCVIHFLVNIKVYLNEMRSLGKKGSEELPIEERLEE